MSSRYVKLVEIVNKIKEQIDFTPSVAVVLGSGLGNFANKIQHKKTIDYASLQGFPVSTVSGHEGRFVFGTVGKTRVVCMQGRVHFYEGYSASDVVMPVQVMRMLGAKTIILTNASGGINSSFEVGDFMQITDHISSFVLSPLIGENIDELQTRFPDMSEVYSKNLINLVENIAKSEGINLKKGVYLQTTGPNYETPREIKMYGLLGADAVGMSTAIEAMVANAIGMEVCGISLITNKASGLGSKLSHEEVKAVADKKTAEFENLLQKILIKLGD